MSAARPHCGTPRGYRAHRTHKEPSCRACKDVMAAAERERQQAKRDAKARGEDVSAATSRPKAREVFISEVEFLVSCGEGWQRVLNAVGTPSPEALTQRLYKAGRYDLAQVLDLPRRYDEKEAA